MPLSQDALSSGMGPLLQRQQLLDQASAEAALRLERGPREEARQAFQVRKPERFGFLGSRYLSGLSAVENFQILFSVSKVYQDFLKG